MGTPQMNGPLLIGILHCSMHTSEYKFFPVISKGLTVRSWPGALSYVVKGAYFTTILYRLELGQYRTRYLISTLGFGRHIRD